MKLSELLDEMDRLNKIYDKLDKKSRKLVNTYTILERFRVVISEDMRRGKIVKDIGMELLKIAEDKLKEIRRLMEETEIGGG